MLSISLPSPRLPPPSTVPPHCAITAAVTVRARLGTDQVLLLLVGGRGGRDREGGRERGREGEREREGGREGGREGERERDESLKMHYVRHLVS